MSLRQRQAQGDGGGGGGSNSSALSQPFLTPTILAVESTSIATSVYTVITSTSTSVSQWISTTSTTYTASATITQSETKTALSSMMPDSISQSSDNQVSLLYKIIIIVSVLGGFTIILIIILAITYCLYKRRRRKFDLDTPPLTSLYPPTRSPLRRQFASRSPAPGETSLSMGPGVYIPPKAPSRGRARTSPPRPKRSLDSSPAVPPERETVFVGVPAITVQPSTPAIPQRGEEGFSSTEGHGIQRPAPAAAIPRPFSDISGMTDLEVGGQQQGDPALREIIDRRHALYSPSARASSAVFPEVYGIAE